MSMGRFLGFHIGIGGSVRGSGCGECGEGMALIERESLAV